MQCPEEGHISAPVQCDQKSDQVPMWLAQTNVASNTVSASAGSLTDAVTSMLSTSQPDQMPVAQSNLIANMMSDVTDTDSSIILELTVDVGPSGVGPDVSGNEIKQILQDPFGDLATFEKSGKMSAITAHVAEVILQTAGTLNGLGANDDMDVEITYEFDLAAQTLAP
ncbi:hypothetical protein WJX79_010016 [Trebouxia sp. C0005]